jgi:hypothetical protein
VWLAGEEEGVARDDRVDQSSSSRGATPRWSRRRERKAAKHAARATRVGAGWGRSSAEERCGVGAAGAEMPRGEGAREE